jgi:hypothetical protein
VPFHGAPIGRGHRVSIAATIATTSSSVGAGDTEASDTGAGRGIWPVGASQLLTTVLHYGIPPQRAAEHPRRQAQ